MKKKDGRVAGGLSGMGMLVLLRHGQCVDNLTNVLPRPWTPLTGAGEKEARLAARRLRAHLDAPRVVASLLPRARRTATIVATGLGGVLEEDADLGEMDFGAAAGCTPEQFERLFPEHARRIVDSHDLLYSWPGGESRASLLGRVRRLLDRWLVRARHGDIVLVSHWVTLGFVHAVLLHGSHHQWERLAPPHARPVAFRLHGEGGDGKGVTYLPWSWVPEGVARDGFFPPVPTEG